METEESKYWIVNISVPVCIEADDQVIAEAYALDTLEVYFQDYLKESKFSMKTKRITIDEF